MRASYRRTTRKASKGSLNPFSPVVSAREVQFPNKLQSLDELGAQLAAADAKISQAQTFGIAGVVVGVLGMIGGVAALAKRK